MKFDEIGEWTRIKLDIIEQYAVPYAQIMSKQMLKFYYIDAFSGAGIHIDRETGADIDGSPLRILRGNIPFDKYYFIDLDSKKADFLGNYCEKNFPDRKIEVRQGDCNEIIEDIVSGMEYKNYERVFCLLDPYGLHLNWEIIEMMGKKNIVDLILNFPIMDMNRNAIWHDYKKVPEQDRNRMTQFWGDESWFDTAYSPSLQSDIFNSNPVYKQSNEVITNAFQKRLKNVAGFKHVPKPIPLKISNGSTIYYLFFASQNATANRIAKSIFTKYGG